MDMWHGSLGADPEVFVFAGRKLLPAYEFLPSKIDPKRPSIYWDGFQAEWKYTVGQNCLTMFVMDTQVQMRSLYRKARGHNDKATLSLQNVVTIPKPLLDKAPEQYVALGCEPSYNAYDMQPEKIADPREFRFRVAGGHAHFGGWKGKGQHIHNVKVLDSILGVWAVGAARNIDIPLRRRYYGMAGEFRAPRYAHSQGLEYRTLSNFWLCHPRIMQVTFEIARGALAVAHQKSNPWVATEEEVIRTINDCDVDHAKKILKRNQIVFHAMLTTRLFRAKDRQAAFQVGMKGVENEVNITSMPRNWKLDEVWDYGTTPRWATRG